MKMQVEGHHLIRQYLTIVFTLSSVALWAIFGILIVLSLYTGRSIELRFNDYYEAVPELLMSAFLGITGLWTLVNRGQKPC